MKSGQNGFFISPALAFCYFGEISPVVYFSQYLENPHLTLGFSRLEFKA